jgi:hypothetical protein
MAIPGNFSAMSWFMQNTTGGSRLTQDTLQAVADFTTMWNFFEGNLCRNAGGLAAFDRIVEDYRPDEATHEKLLGCIDYWRSRYLSEGLVLPRLEKLEFRPRDRRDHVESVLLGETNGKGAVLLALLIIIYRLRNNLFHGLKTLDILNDQVENLKTATYCLSIVLSAVPSNIVHPRHV